MENVNTEHNQLYEAVKNQDLEVIQTIVAQEVYLYQLADEVYDDDFGAFVNPVQKAVHLRDKQIISILLQAISNLKVRNLYIFGSLDIAAILGDINIFQYLLNSLSSHFSRRDLSDVLKSAIWGGNKDIVKLLIDMDVNINTIFETEETPLMTATRKGDIDLVKMIVKAGADVNILNEQLIFLGSFIFSHREVDREISRYLLSLISDIRYEEISKMNLTEIVFTLRKDREIIKNFILAAEQGNIIEVQEAIQAGVDITAFDESGETALHKAARVGQSEIVRILLDAGVQPDIWGLGYTSTPLMNAIGSNLDNYDIVTILLEAGANPNILVDSKTPLMAAANNGKLRTTQILLEFGADVKIVNHEKETALLLAKKYSEAYHSLEIFNLLKKAGAMEEYTIDFEDDIPF